MYQLSVDDGVRTARSLDDLRAWLRQGRITLRTPVVDLTRNVEVEVEELLRDSSLETPEYDPRDELERRLAAVSEKKPADFSDEELAELQAYMKVLKRQDLEGQVDWEQVVDFRKRLRKIEIAVLERNIRADMERSSQAATGTGEDFRVEEIFIPVPLPPPPRRTPPRASRPAPRPASRPAPKPAGKTDEKAPGNFWHSPFVIVLALIFFAPAGVLLLWTGPKKGLLGNTAVRLALTAGFGYFWLQETKPEWFDSETLVSTETAAGPSVEVGASFSEEGDWSVGDVRDAYPVQGKIYFLVRGLACQESQVLDRVRRLDGDGPALVQENRFDWNPAHDLYTHHFVPEQPGQYRVEILCGETLLAEKTVTVAAP